METVDLGYTPSPVKAMNGISPVAPSDYSVKNRVSGQITLINKNSPLDRVQELRYQSREIDDIYKNSGVNPTMMSPNRTGRNIAAVFSCVARVTDSDCCDKTRDLPLKATLSITIPNDASISKDIVQTLLCSVLSSWAYPSEWVDQPTPAWDRAYALVKGALEPDLTETLV